MCANRDSEPVKGNAFDASIAAADVVVFLAAAEKADEAEVAMAELAAETGIVEEEDEVEEGGL